MFGLQQVMQHFTAPPQVEGSHDAATLALNQVIIDSSHIQQMDWVNFIGRQKRSYSRFTYLLLTTYHGLHQQMVFAELSWKGFVLS